MKKIIFILIFFLMLSKVCAVCSNKEIKNLKSFVNNVTYTYDYYLENEQAFFNVNLYNLTDNLYIIDNYNKRYDYYNTTNGQLSLYSYQNSVNFTFYSVNCDNEKIGNINISFPIYNKYYKEGICSDFSEYSWCHKWTNKVYTYEEIESLNRKTKDETKIVDEKDNKSDIFDKINSLYVKYYYIFLPIIIILGIVIMRIINKKQRFELLG